jgi:hypothetical protein
MGRRLKVQGTPCYRLGAHHLRSLRILKRNRGRAWYWQARRGRSPVLPALQFQRRNPRRILGPASGLRRSPMIMQSVGGGAPWGEQPVGQRYRCGAGRAICPWLSLCVELLNGHGSRRTAIRGRSDRGA